MLLIYTSAICQDPSLRFDFRRFAPCARANRNDMEGVNNVEQTFGMLNDDVVAAHEDKFRMRDGKLLPVGGADD